MAISKRSEPVSYQLPLRVAFDGLMAMLAFTSLTPQHADAEQGIISARRGMSLRSWGEKVTISLSESGPGQTSAQVESRLVFGLFAWGQHDRNIQTVLRALAILEDEGGPPAGSPPPDEPPPEPPPG